MRRIFIGAALVGLCAAVFTAQLAAKKSSSDIETKIAIEKNLEERLRKILTEITGTDKFIIVINAQLVSAAAESEEDEVVLPGVPLQEKLGLGIASLDLGDSAKNIKKLSVQIIVDESLPESIVNIIKEVSANILGLQNERGDSLTIKKMNFRKSSFRWAEIIYPPNLWGLLFSLLAVIFIAVSLFFAASVFPGSAGALSEKIANSLKKTETQGFAAAPLAAGGPAGAFAASASPADVESGKEGKHFSFVTTENVDKLIFLLSKETPENIAVLINFAPHLAGRILSGLDPAVSKEAVSRLTYTRTLPAEEVTEWESELKTKLNFMAGGESAVMDILENMDEKDADSYIDFIKEGDSEFADAISGKLFRLSSLPAMKAEDIVLIFQNFSPSAFADVVRTLSEKERGGILSKLPEGIATRIKEEIELTTPPGEEKIKEEKTLLRRIVGRLKKDGLLT